MNMFISNILEQVAGGIELAAGEVQLAWIKAGDDDKPVALPENSGSKFSSTSIYLNDPTYIKIRDRLEKKYCKDHNMKDVLKFVGNYATGAFSIIRVVGLIKGINPADGERTISEPDEGINADVTLLEYIGTTERFTAPVYSKAKSAPIIEYTDPFNNRGVYFDDEIIEYAFESIKAKDPAKECRVKSDIKNGNLIMFSFIDTNNNGIPAIETAQGPEKEREVVHVDCEVHDVVRPAIEMKEEEEGGTDRVIPINFNEYGYNIDMRHAQPVTMTKKVYNTVEKFMLEAFGPDARYSYTPVPSGLFQIYVESLNAAYTIDPNIVIGNGVNLLTNVAYKNEMGMFEYSNVFVNIEMDIAIALRAVRNPEYILPPAEYHIALSRQFANSAIYAYVDMSDMSGKITKMSKDNFAMLGKKLTGIINCMNTPCRFRFINFKSINKFSLISDIYVKSPLPGETNTLISNIQVDLENDGFKVYDIGSNELMYEAELEYGDI